MRDTLRAFLTNLLAVLVGVRPDVAEAVQQQRAVTGDVHSRKADLSPLAAQLLRLMEQEDQYRAAAACAERGLYGAAAEWAIRASSEHGTCRVVNPQEAQ